MWKKKKQSWCWVFRGDRSGFIKHTFLASYFLRDKTFHIRNMTLKRFTYIVIMTIYLYYSRTAYRHNSILSRFTLYTYYVKKISGGYLYASINFLSTFEILLPYLVLNSNLIKRTPKHGLLQFR